jgi:hypothetical protein
MAPSNNEKKALNLKEEKRKDSLLLAICNGGDNIGRFDYMYCILVYISMEVTTLVGLTICIVCQVYISMEVTTLVGLTICIVCCHLH